MSFRYWIFFCFVVVHSLSLLFKPRFPLYFTFGLLAHRLFFFFDEWRVFSQFTVGFLGSLLNCVEMIKRKQGERSRGRENININWILLNCALFSKLRILLPKIPVTTLFPLFPTSSSPILILNTFTLFREKTTLGVKKCVLSDQRSWNKLWILAWMNKNAAVILTTSSFSAIAPNIQSTIDMKRGESIWSKLWANKITASH